MKRWPAVYCALAGGGDALTGILLLAAPTVTLRWMAVRAVPAETVYLRYVGVFVAAVGLSYALPWLGSAAERAVALRTVLRLTTVVRFAVALFVATAIVGGSFELAWLSVVLTDAGFGTAQLWILRSDAFAGEAGG